MGLFWRSERDSYANCKREKVQVYKCEFTAKVTRGSGPAYNANVSVLVVADDVEDAITACREQWPTEFVLHSVNKHNQRCDLIITAKALQTAEEVDK